MFKVGQRVWHGLRDEWGTVRKVTPRFLEVRLDNSLTVFLDPEGKLSTSKNPVLFANKFEWPNPEPPLPDLANNALILVSRGENGFQKRHFKCWSDDGKPVCWADGKTSYTTGFSYKWSEWKLPEDTEDECPY